MRLAVVQPRAAIALNSQSWQGECPTQSLEHAGHIVYQGPTSEVKSFFGQLGFKCPERKGVADFLQEVTSAKDQQVA